MRLLTVFAVLGALVIAGSTALREPAGARERSDADSSSAAPNARAARGTAARAGVVAPVRAAAAPLPRGGESLQTDGECPDVAGTPSVTQLQAGLAGIQSAGWRSADGGVSAAVSDGRVLWFFGDTVKLPGAAGPTMVGNSLLMSSGSCFVQVTHASPGALFADESKAGVQTVVWPTGVVTLDRGTWDEVWVFGNRVRRSGGFWGFTLLGTTLSRMAVPHGGAPRLLETRTVTPDDDSPTHITWGTGVYADGANVYVYGTRRVGGSLGREVFVARAPVASLDDITTWRYRGSGFWGGVEVATPVLSASPGVSHIVSVFRRDGATYLVSKVGGDLADDVGVWRASSAEGPFRLVGRTRRPYELTGHQIRYMPLAHPEYQTGSNLVVTMSRNVTQGTAIGADHSLGRPEVFTVTLPR